MKNTLKKVMAIIITATLVIGGVSIMSSAMEPTYVPMKSQLNGEADYIWFGSYPQSEVEDTATIAALNAAVKADDWTSYNYVSGANFNEEAEDLDTALANVTFTTSNLMEYADVTVGTEKYRGVKINNYRPAYTVYGSECNEQEDNYDLNTVYWFAFEDLLWQVVDAETGLIATVGAIDAQAYNNTLKENATDLATSDIKAWLNNEFASTAFDTVTDYITSDVTLLTAAQATTMVTTSNTDTATATDYALIQGLKVRSSGIKYWVDSTAAEGIEATIANLKTKAAGSEISFATCNAVRPAVKVDTALFTSENGIDIEANDTSKKAAAEEISTEEPTATSTDADIDEDMEIVEEDEGGSRNVQVIYATSNNGRSGRNIIELADLLEMLFGRIFKIFRTNSF